MATVSTSMNLTAVPYVAGEDITVNSGAILTIDATPSPNPGSLICITYGEVLIENASPTTPLVVTLSDAVKDFRFEKNGVLRINGAMIELTPGTGAAQTWDFTVAPLNTIPYPAHVEVEDSAGSNTYTPWLVFATVGKTVVTSAALFGASAETGNVLFWNHTTRALTSGNGTNGNSVSVGRKVRIPNVYLHSATTSATQANRTQIDLSPTGRLFAVGCGFSDHIYFVNSGSGEVSLTGCGFSGLFSHSNANAPFSLNRVSFGRDTGTATGSGATIASCFGATSIERVASTHHVLALGASAHAASFNLIPTCTKMERVVALALPRGNVASIGLALTQVGAVRMDDMVSLGGHCLITDCSNTTFNRLKHSDGLDTTQTATNPQWAINIATSSKLRFVDFAKAGVRAARNGIITTDNRSNDIDFFGGSYDCSNNGATSAFNFQGVRTNVYNFQTSNLRTASRYVEAPTANTSEAAGFFNCRATLVGTCTNEGVRSSFLDGVPGTPADWSIPYAAGLGFVAAHLLSSGLAPTQGHVVFSSFSDGPKSIYSGGAQADQAGLLEMPTSGAVAELESPVFRGVSAFAVTAPRYSYTESGSTVANSTVAPPNCTLEFAVATPTGAFGAYAALTGANLAGALAALGGYSLSAGFRVRLRLTANTTDATRIIRLVYWETVYSPAYIAAESSVTLLGPDLTDTVEMRLVSDNSLLHTFTGPGVQTFSGAALVGVGVYFVRKTASSVEIMRTQVSPITISIGDNGEIALYAGSAVQVASASALVPQIADAVWDEPRASHVTAGTFGATAEWAGGGGGGGGLDAPATRAALGLASANLDAQLAAIKADTAAIRVDTDVTLPAAIGDIPTNGEMTALLDAQTVAIGGLLVSAPSIASAVWESARGDYTTPGTFGVVAEWAGIPLTAAGTRSALGMAAADLDTQLGALASGVADVLEDTGTTLPAQIAALPTPLDAAATRSALGMAAANLDTQISNVPGAVRTELSVELGRIDVAVSSRLASAGYVAPLTAAGTRSAVGLASADLDTQLSGLSTAISNRPTYAQVETLLEASAENMGYVVWDHLLTESVAPGTFGAEVAKSTELQPASAAALNAYDPPTHAELTSATAAVPAAVRTELATELNRIDAAVSTRLASGSYVVPLDASATRSAIGLASANLDTQLGLLTAGLAAVFEDTGTTLPSQIAALPTPLTAPGVRGAIGLASANLDTQLLQLDTAIGTRLASSSYVIPLDAAATRAAVGLSSANLDAQISDIPDAVRAELTVELDRIDVAISTRAEPGSGMTAADIRSAIGISDPNLEAMLGIINTGVQLSSLIVPHTEDLP